MKRILIYFMALALVLHWIIYIVYLNFYVHKEAYTVHLNCMERCSSFNFSFYEENPDGCFCLRKGFVLSAKADRDVIVNLDENISVKLMNKSV